MGIQLCRLKVKNYRGINETEVLIPKTGVFFGDFLMGKTSIFEALSLALGVNYWVDELNIDSFYRGMVNFEEFVESEQIMIRLLLTGFDNKEHFEKFIGPGNEMSLAYWDAEAKELSYDLPQKNHELAVEIVYVAKMGGSEVLNKRYLARKDSKDLIDGDELPYDKNLAEALGFFYIPFRSSNNRKWLEKSLHESHYEIDQWKERAKSYLNVFQETHREMEDFMNQIDKRRSQKVSDNELSEDIIKFVSKQVFKVSNASMKGSVQHVTSDELLNSFRSVVDAAGFRDLLQIIGANSYNFQGKCVLSGVIKDVLDRIEQKKPCVLFLDEPEAFFEKTFFWEKLVNLVKKDDNMNIVMATHNREIVNFFSEGSRVYIHNVFGNIAVLDEVLFNGLYQ